MTADSLFLIKDKKGQIEGPFKEEEIIQKIKKQEIDEQDQISKYPDANWKKLSNHPAFHQALLDQLSRTQIHPPPSDTAQKTTQKTTKEKMPKTPDPSFKRVRFRKKSSEDPEVIEMRSERSEFLEELKKKLKWGLILTVVVILGIVFFSPEPSAKRGEFALIAPRWDQAPLPEEQVWKKVNQGFVYYLQDQASLYMKAQNAFIEAIEGNTKHTLAMAYLCLTYFELWPFSGQAPNGLKMISQVTAKLSAIDQGGIHSLVCLFVQHFAKEEFESAMSLIETAVEDFGRNPKAQKISLFLYYLRGFIQNHNLQYGPALSSLDHIQTLMPEWMAPYHLTARIFNKQKNFSEALKAYSNILKVNPNHKSAALGKGILEYQYLGKQREAELSIKKALNLKDEALAEDLALAYFILTQIALKKNEPKAALDYAKKSYAIDPENKQLKDIISQLGSQDQIKKTKVKSQQLIEKGDQLTREGRLLEAGSYYKIAFEVDEGRNSVAGKKMGQNLWKLGLAREAIEWLKKSVTADPDHLSAYILLSDYYSQTYDFENASRILSTANKRSPNSVDIFKGFALLHFRRNDLNRSIAYSKKALELYESDVDSLILLSKARSAMGDFEQALKMAGQAVETNSNSKEARIQYAVSGGRTYGVDWAFDYLENLISQSEQHSQNHIDYTTALAQFLFENEQYDQARLILQNLESLENKPIEYYLLLGQIAVKKEQPNQAYEEFISASSINPSDPRVMMQLGRFLSRTKKYTEARSYFKKILASYSRYPQIHFYIARTFLLEGGKENLEEALKEAKIETQINPSSPIAFQLLGDIYDRLRKYTLCAGAFQKAIEMLPEESELYIRSAVCYRKAGELDLALRILTAAAGDDQRGRSSNPRVYREMGALYEIKKDFDSAVKAYGTYLKLSPGAEDKEMIENRVNNFGNE